jgi:hypothetical protein
VAQNAAAAGTDVPGYLSQAPAVSVFALQDGAVYQSYRTGLVVYAAALALSWASAPLAVALCGLMALYYAFDQASVPAAAEPDDQQPAGRSA